MVCDRCLIQYGKGVLILVVSSIVFLNNDVSAYPKTKDASTEMCRVIDGKPTFKHSGTGDFVEVPPTKKGCRGTGGKTEQDTCRQCYEEWKQNSSHGISQIQQSKKELFLSSV